MDDAPAPLTPADCDLRDFQFMPLEVHRLLTSETWLLGTSDEKVAALTLWLVAWHQLPAGSLPDNERMLAHLSGAGVSGWKKVRDHALRGWVKCSDGRLYHPVVAEKVRDSWAKKEAQRERSKKGNSARWASKKDAVSTPTAIPQGSKSDPIRMPEGVLEVSLKDPKGEGDIRESPLKPPQGGDAMRKRKMPTHNDPPKAWLGIVGPDEWSIPHKSMTGAKEPCVGGWFIDVVLGDFIEAAGFRCDVAYDWETAFAWLRDGADPHEQITPTIKAVAASMRAKNNPATSFKAFDRSVRAAANLAPGWSPPKVYQMNGRHAV